MSIIDDLQRARATLDEPTTPTQPRRPTITQRERDDLAAMGISVDDGDVMATGTYAKQRGGTRIPRQPTEGWMRHELEANGVRALGVPMTTSQLVAALRRLGYEVE